MKKDNLLALPVRLILVPLRTVFYTLRTYELVYNITSYYGYIMYIYIIITLRARSMNTELIKSDTTRILLARIMLYMHSSYESYERNMHNNNTSYYAYELVQQKGTSLFILEIHF